MMTLVNEIMYPVAQALRADMVLPEAVQLILDSGFTGLPVLDAQERVIGFLSEHDCIPLLLNGSYHCDNRTLVRDIMYNEPLTVTRHDNIVDLAQRMQGVKPKVYPVVEGERLVGLVSRHHVMQALNKAFRDCKIVA